MGAIHDAGASKSRVLEHCKQLIADKLRERRAALQELIASAANETKSTAGDKYETTRAMLHLEQDKVRAQLAQMQAQQAILSCVDASAIAKTVGPGSLIITDSGTYFMSIGLGKVVVDGQQIIALSAESPLGAKMMRLNIGDRLVLNGREIVIQQLS